jgi:O-antigen ligase
MKASARADALMLPLALLFVGAGFVVAPEPSWAFLFYVAGVPLLLWRVAPRIAPWLREPVVLLPVLLVAWMAATLMWSDAPRPHDLSRALWLWNCLCTLGFFLNLLLVAVPAAGSARLSSTLIGMGTLNAVFSIGRFLVAGGVGERMPGWAETRHPILGAGIIGLCLVLALGRACTPGIGRRVRAGLLAAVVVMAGFIWLTGSRGPLVAVAAGCAVLLLGLPRRVLLGLVAAVLLAVLGLHLADRSVLPEALGRLTERGWSSRLDIWQQSLEMIRLRPVFGHGLTALLPRAKDAFPHDLYLSTLLYGGAVGLALLLGSFALAARGVARLPAGLERRTLAALGVTACLIGATDLSQVVKGPGPMWYIIWLPLVLCVAAARRAAPGAGETTEEFR